MGLIVGAVGTWLLLRRGDALHSPAWQAAIAWQGWVGAVVGAIASVLVAVWVLRVTIRHNHALLVEEQAAQRSLALADRRLAAWAAFAVELRRFADMPVDFTAFRTAETSITTAYWTWRLTVEEADLEVAEGVERTLNACIMIAAQVSEETRELNRTTFSDDPTVAVSDSRTDMLIGHLMMYGEAWHRGGASAVAARRVLVEWKAEA